MRSNLILISFAGLLAVGAVGVAAGVMVGANPPSQPVTVERIATLPKRQQGVWKAYLERSTKQMQVDKDTLKAEQAKYGMPKEPFGPHGGNARTIPLNKDAAWYGSADATRIANNVMSYQTPSGGWSKNLDMSKGPRLPGQNYMVGPDATASLVTPDDFGRVSDSHWGYVGTIDNDATITQVRYLAKVVTALGANPAGAAKYRAADLRGVEYLLWAQYPNGGWPQIWPLAGGYHDGITYNDDAMIQVIELLQDAAAGKNEFGFVPTDMRKRAGAAVEKGIECILATQVVTGGMKTAWGQQYDALTQTPTSARNYEMPSISTGESAGILNFLMEQPKPTGAEKAAIHAGVAWLKKVAIKDMAWRPTPSGRDVVAAPGAGLIWARYYQIGTDRPLFGDRDKSIHDKVTEISLERRNGYAWYGSAPRAALQKYDAWLAAHQ